MFLHNYEPVVRCDAELPFAVLLVKSAHIYAAMKEKEKKQRNTNLIFSLGAGGGCQHTHTLTHFDYLCVCFAY